MDVDVVLKRFEKPDETRVLALGLFEIVRLGGMTIGRATYQPGWKWSLHVGPELGLTRCPVEHAGLVVSGEASRCRGSPAPDCPEADCHHRRVRVAKRPLTNFFRPIGQRLAIRGQ